jgi:hypothetical protein
MITEELDLVVSAVTFILASFVGLCVCFLYSPKRWKFMINLVGIAILERIYFSARNDVHFLSFSIPDFVFSGLRSTAQRLTFNSSAACVGKPEKSPRYIRSGKGIFHKAYTSAMTNIMRRFYTADLRHFGYAVD